MSAQANQLNANYMPELGQPERRVTEVEQEIVVLNRNGEALALCVDQLEKRLSSVLSTRAVDVGSNPKPEVVRVPLANMIMGANGRLHGSITRLNDIIDRIELPE